MTGLPYDEGLYKSRLDRAIERRSIEDESTVLVPCYGVGTQIDVEAYLSESSKADEIIASLDPLEKFTVFGYYILKKPQYVLARMLELGDGRFTKFLRGCAYKIAASILFGDIANGAWKSIYRNERQTGILATNVTDTKRVYISEIIEEFLRSRSFKITAEKFNLHYVNMRVMLEKHAEKLSKSSELVKCAFGNYLKFVVEFNSLNGEGYTGNLAKNRSVLKITDPKILASNTYRIEDENIESVLSTRAAFTQ